MQMNTTKPSTNPVRRPAEDGEGGGAVVMKPDVRPNDEGEFAIMVKPHKKSNSFKVLAVDIQTLDNPLIRVEQQIVPRGTIFSIIGFIS
jgi:hypothetical protein